MKYLKLVSVITLASAVALPLYAATPKNKKKKKVTNYHAPVVKKHNFKVNFDQTGLNVTRDDGAFSTNLYGYVEQDVVKFNGSGKLLRSGTNVRTARVFLTGNMLTNWQYSIVYDLASSTLKNAKISYHGWKNQVLGIGQFTPNVGLSNYSELLDINFLDYALPVYAFSPDYVQGLRYAIHGNTWMVDTSVFGGATGSSYARSNPIGATGRVVYAPIHTDGRLLHFGVSDWWQRPNNTATVTFSTIPEVTSHNGDTLINTGSIIDIKYYNVWSAELAGEHGPWTLQGEYYSNDVHRKNGLSNLRFSGYYATLGYFLTGQYRTYFFPDAVFGPPSSTGGKYGAWQVLARFSSVNLSDKEIKGGKEFNETLGLNWFVNDYVTFKFNVIHAEARPASNNKNVTSMIYAARMQVSI